MKFSKEYIKECDCPEIQGLFKMTAINRNNDILIGCLKNIKGSLFHNRDEHYYLATSPEKVIWLPTGDQLTDLIFKHCHTYNLDITLYHEHHCRDCSKCCIAMEANYANGHLIEKEIDIEAREYEIKLAKIKLLKELLKESGE